MPANVFGPSLSEPAAYAIDASSELHYFEQPFTLFGTDITSGSRSKMAPGSGRDTPSESSTCHSNHTDHFAPLDLSISSIKDNTELWSTPISQRYQAARSSRLNLAGFVENESFDSMLAGWESDDVFGPSLLRRALPHAAARTALNEPGTQSELSSEIWLRQREFGDGIPLDFAAPVIASGRIESLPSSLGNRLVSPAPTPSTPSVSTAGEYLPGPQQSSSVRSGHLSGHQHSATSNPQNSVSAHVGAASGPLPRHFASPHGGHVSGPQHSASALGGRLPVGTCLLRPLESLDVEGVGLFLSALDLGEYAASFTAGGVKGRQLVFVQDLSDLEELGVRCMHKVDFRLLLSKLEECKKIGGFPQVMASWRDTLCCS